MKKILRNIFLVLIFAATEIMLFFTAIRDLTNKQDVHTLQAVYGVNVLEVEHSINGLIPFGKDYYYLIMEEDTYDAYFVRAPKNWDEENFPGTDPDTEYPPVEITGLAKKITDYEMEKEFLSLVEYLNTDTSEEEAILFPLGQTTCIDIAYVGHCWMKIVAASLLLVLVIIGALTRLQMLQTRSVAGKIYAVLFIIDMLLLLISLR